MSTQIDPVTGLPVFAPAPLEEIPMTNWPFPWNDLTDNPVPPRPIGYPSDIIPTTAAVVGMHPTEQGSQTVNTDGNHALLVKDIASGGASYVKAKYAVNVYGMNISGTGVSYNSFNPWTATSGLVAITAIQVSFTVTAVITPGQPHDVDIRILDSNGNNEIAIIYVVPGDGTVIYGDGRYFYEKTFIPAIDIAATWGANLPIEVYLSSANCSWTGQIGIRGTAV